jgi:type IV secretory pathway VirB10-like protein
MAEENEKKVQEKPATHNKKGQIFIFGGIVVLLVVVALSSVLRMNSGTKLMDDQPATAQTVDGPSARQKAINFESRFKQAQDERLRSSGVAQDGESYEEMIRRIRAEIEAELAAKNKQRALVTEQGGGEIAKKRDWSDEELDRVRTSRYDDYDLNLGFNNKGPLLAANRTRNTGGFSNGTGFSRSQAAAGPGAGLERHLASIDDEIRRAGAVRQRLEAEQARQGSAAPSPASFNFDADRQAGQSASKSPNGQPLPGQLELPIGTVIRAAIDQKVMSDYVGSLRLQITHDVYDLSRQHILIPAGSICTAQSMLINNINAPIQSRMGYLVKNLRLPDGKIVDFSKQVGLDREGIAAVEGEVDRHLMAQFLGVAAYALIANGTSYSGSGDGDSTYSGQVGQDARDQFAPLAQKYLNLVPTITLKPGDPVRIFIEEPVYIYPWASIRGNYVSAR